MQAKHLEEGMQKIIDFQVGNIKGKNILITWHVQKSTETPSNRCTILQDPPVYGDIDSPSISFKSKKIGHYLSSCST